MSIYKTGVMTQPKNAVIMPSYTTFEEYDKFIFMMLNGKPFTDNDVLLAKSCILQILRNWCFMLAPCFKGFYFGAINGSLYGYLIWDEPTASYNEMEFFKSNELVDYIVGRMSDGLSLKVFGQNYKVLVTKQLAIEIFKSFDCDEG